MTFQTIEDIINHYRKEHKQMELNKVSSCCGASIEQGSMIEYPTGGSTWGINYRVDMCTSCNKECEQVDECGICGTVGCLNQCQGAEPK